VIRTTVMLFPRVWRNHENSAATTHFESAIPYSKGIGKPLTMSRCLLSCTCTRALDVFVLLCGVILLHVSEHFLKHGQWHVTILRKTTKRVLRQITNIVTASRINRYAFFLHNYYIYLIDLSRRYRFGTAVRDKGTELPLMPLCSLTMQWDIP
jgi:hypothetical protein